MTSPLQRKLTILIVEDQDAVIAIWKHFLHPINCDLLIAKTFADGKSLLELYHPDLVLLDLRLTDSTVDETISRIKVLKELSPLSTIVVISGYVTPAMAELAINQGAEKVIQKEDVRCQTELWAVIIAAIKGKPDAHYTFTTELLEQLTCQYTQKQQSQQC